MHSPRFSTAFWLAACLAWASLALPCAQAAPDINGSYATVVRGDFNGKGTIAIGDKKLNITLHVTNEAGETGLLKASVDLVDGRFTGEGTVMGKPMTISGRIDPADDAKGPIKAARIQATFTTTDGLGGRLVGDRRGGGG